MVNCITLDSISLFFIIFLTIVKISLEQNACILANAQNNFVNTTYSIPDPNICTSITNNCCYISSSYYIGSNLIEGSYCASMSGKVESFRTNLFNSIKDQMLHYANSSKYFNHKYKQIGNNLNYTFYDNYQCWIPPRSEKEYSSYITEHCATFSENRTCLHVNDYDYFQSFLVEFYEKLTANYCNSIDLNGECKKESYKDYPNNNALGPLMEILKGSLKVDKGNITVQETNSTDGYSQCITPPFDKIKVEVICPESYSSSFYLKIKSFLFIILFILINSS